MLLRVCDLAGLNRAIGHEATDRLLQSVADVLRAYPDRGGGCFVGRLNGSDFALGLPVPGVAAESAQSLAQALSAALTSFGLPVSVALGAVEIRPGATASALLAAVDAALARSETSGPFAWVRASSLGSFSHNTSTVRTFDQALLAYRLRAWTR